MTINIWQAINDYKLIKVTILFSTKELEARALLEPSNYLNPRMSTRDEDNEKEKRLGRNLFHVIVISGQTWIIVSITLKLYMGLDGTSIGVL